MQLATPRAFEKVGLTSYYERPAIANSTSVPSVHVVSCKVLVDFRHLVHWIVVPKDSCELLIPCAPFLSTCQYRTSGVGKETKRNTVALRAELRATLQYIALIPMHYIVHVLSNFLDVFTIPQA